MENRRKKVSYKAHTAKIIMFLIVSIALINVVSAWEFDNGIDYYKKDMIAVFENAWGFGTEIGKAELTSHTSVTEVRNIIRGEDRVVMYYDFYDWNEVYENGLGKVTFTDKNTGKKINKDFKFVYPIYKEITINNYTNKCGADVYCSEDIINKYNVTRLDRWEELGNKDIPKENIKIGIMLDVLEGEHLDAIWTIANVEVKKHAEWTESLNAGLVAYWSMDDGSNDSRIIDVVTGLHNASDTGGDFVYNTTSTKLGNATTWANGDEGKVVHNAVLTPANNLSFGGWVLTTGGGTYGWFISHNDDNGGLSYGIRRTNTGYYNCWITTNSGVVQSTSSSSVITIYQHIMCVYNGTDVSLYFDGSQEDQDTQTGTMKYTLSDQPLCIGFWEDNSAGNQYWIGNIDELGLWNRSLTQSEITQLYNGGTGITYISFADVITPNVTINSPTNTTYTTTSITFNITCLDEKLVDSAWATIDGGESNYTLTNTSVASEWFYTNTSMIEGQYKAKFYCNDSSGNINNTESVDFTLDLSYPTINITYPINKSYSIDITRINITYVEANPDKCWYSNDSGVTNSTPQDCNINFTGLNYPQGSHTITTYINDTAGNANYSSPVTFYIDSIFPEINITTPINNSNSSDTGLDVNYIYTETFVDSIWYSKDYGVSNTSLVVGENITTETWAEGDNNITIWINDTLNNLNSTQVFFTIDTTAPIINIVLPLNQTYITNYTTNTTIVFELNWTQSDDNLDSCWYYTNTSVNMSVTCGDNQTLSLDYGTYTIGTCANDSVNNIACDSVTAVWNYVLKENTITFNASEYETASHKFKADVEINLSALSTSANLIYNGSSYSSVVDCNGAYCNLTNTIDIPLVYRSTIATNYSFYWEFSTTDGTTTYNANTSTSYQNVSRIYLLNCSTTITAETLNFTAYIEQNLTKLTAWDYEGFYDFWLGSGSVYRNYSSSATTNEYTMCINPYNYTFYTTAQIRYGKVGYVTRDYYFYEESLSNETQKVKLLLLPTGDSTSFIVKVIDSDQLAVANAYVYVYRFDVGTGEYNIAEVSITDSAGATISHFEEDVVDYKVIIMLNGTAVFSGEKQKIYCEEVPCSVTFQLTGDANTIWSDFGDLSQLTHSLTFDSVTNTWNYTYIDASGGIDWARLYVYNLTGDSKNTICNTTSTLSAATLLCDVSDQDGQTYAASYISRSPEILLNLKSAIVKGLKAIFATEGLFLSMFVLLVLGLAGLWNPAVGIFLIVTGMIMLSILGLASFGAVAIWAIIFIAAILLWELKT